jgi:hypothetical protein
VLTSTSKCNIYLTMDQDEKIRACREVVESYGRYHLFLRDALLDMRLEEMLADKVTALEKKREKRAQWRRQRTRLSWLL